MTWLRDNNTRLNGDKKMSKKQYGFFTEEYEDGSTIETLMTGDGKSQFSDVNHSNGLVGLGIGYGQGAGLDTETDHPKGTTTTDIDVKWQVTFERVESIDAMIKALNRTKEILIRNQQDA